MREQLPRLVLVQDKNRTVEFVFEFHNTSFLLFVEKGKGQKTQVVVFPSPPVDVKDWEHESYFD